MVWVKDCIAQRWLHTLRKKNIIGKTIGWQKKNIIMYNIIMAVVWTRGTNDDGKRTTHMDETNNKKRKLFNDVTAEIQKTILVLFTRILLF